MPVSYKDYYSLLSIARNARSEEIRSAYLKLARKYHPDLHSGDRAFEEKFKDVNEAYEVLSDPDKRRRYDALGGEYKHGAPFTPPPRRDFRTQSRTHRPPASGKKGFSDFFEALFGSGRSRDSADRKRVEIRAELILSLESAHHGGLHKVNFKERHRCPVCAGKRRIAGVECNRCRGLGFVVFEHLLEVNIPPGARDGSVIKLSRRDGHDSGRETYVRLKVKPHERFEVSGDDIIVDLPISPWEAVLGADLSVSTLGGTAEIRIAPGAQTGQMLRLKGHGLSKRDGSRGDAYARVAIVVPDEPNGDELELFKELSRISRFDPRNANSRPK